MAVGHAEGPGGADKIKIAHSQHLSAHHTDEGHPAEEEHDSQEPPETGLDDAGQDDEEEEHRKTGPDFGKALYDQVRPASEVPLECADSDADDGAESGETKTKDDGNAKAINEPGEDVPSLIVGTQQVFQGGRRGCRPAQVKVDAAVVVAHWRPQHPAICVDQVLNEWIPVVSRCFKLSAFESGFGVVDKDGNKGLTAIPYEQGAIVGDKLGGQAEAERADEEPQAPPAAAMVAEDLKAPATSGREVHLKAPRFEIDAAIDEGVDEIADDLCAQADQGQQVEGAEDDGIIAIDRRLKAEQPKPIEGENDLCQQGAGEKDVHEG